MQGGTHCAKLVVEAVQADERQSVLGVVVVTHGSGEIAVALTELRPPLQQSLQQHNNDNSEDWYRAHDIDTFHSTARKHLAMAQHDTKTNTKQNTTTRGTSHEPCPLWRRCMRSDLAACAGQTACGAPAHSSKK